MENGMRQKAMAYTVKELAVMSGVTVRTLHFYDEMAVRRQKSATPQNQRVSRVILRQVHAPIHS